MAKFKRGWYHTSARSGLRGRRGPSIHAVSHYVAPFGHNFKATKVITNDHHDWLKSNGGLYYARQYCTAGKYVAPKKKTSVVRAVSPVPGHTITTPYGIRKAGLWTSKGYHTGADFAANAGTPVVAVRSGTVHLVNDRVLGNVIVLYANGHSYWYCHLSSRGVRDGQRVTAGEKIGRVGETGTGALGPHLHFEDHFGLSLNWWARDRNPRW